MARVTGHVFISYSHDSDSAYVEQLAEFLRRHGVPVWFDREIIGGDRWHQVIRDQVDSCVALIVVMSPAAEASVWVNREITRAEKKGRQVFPLLRSGDEFFRLGDVQYEDVSGGQMPSSAFVERLRRRQPASVDPAAVAVLTRQHNDGVAMGIRGDHEGAVRLLRHVVADRVRMLGDDHPDALRSRHELADHVGEAGDPVEAVRLYRDLVADRTRVLGADDPDALLSRRHLAYYVGEAGDLVEAVRLYRDLVVDQTRVLGADDTETLVSRYNLAYYVGEAGDLLEAVRLFRDLVADQTRVLGADHPETLDSRHNLAYRVEQVGDPAHDGVPAQGSGR